MAEKKPWYRSSTFWIFVGLLLGVLLGGFFPQDQYPQAYNFFRFLSKAFIQLIKGLIVPLLFSTIVVGVAQTGEATFHRLETFGDIGRDRVREASVRTALRLLLEAVKG